MKFTMMFPPHYYSMHTTLFYHVLQHGVICGVWKPFLEGSSSHQVWKSTFWTVIGINVQEPFMRGTFPFLYCKVGTCPFKFLGFLVGGNPRRCSTWKPIIDLLLSLHFRFIISLWSRHQNRFWKSSYNFKGISCQVAAVIHIRCVGSAGIGSANRRRMVGLG